MNGPHFFLLLMAIWVQLLAITAQLYQYKQILLQVMQ